jgi:hypothetical protein
MANIMLIIIDGRRVKFKGWHEGGGTPKSGVKISLVCQFCFQVFKISKIKRVKKGLGSLVPAVLLAMYVDYARGFFVVSPARSYRELAKTTSSFVNNLIFDPLNFTKPFFLFLICWHYIGGFRRRSQTDTSDCVQLLKQLRGFDLQSDVAFYESVWLFLLKSPIQQLLWFLILYDYFCSAHRSPCRVKMHNNNSSAAYESGFSKW